MKEPKSPRAPKEGIKEALERLDEKLTGCDRVDPLKQVEDAVRGVWEGDGDGEAENRD